MNKNVLIVLAGAVLVAVLVAVMVQVMIGGKEEAPVAVEEAKINILVADKDLKIGKELQSGDLRWQPWPKSSLFPGAVKQVDGGEADKALEGRLARDIAKGEPVMKSALLGQSKGNFVAASLEPGMRAMAIEVKAHSMVAGFVSPGDYVDVILTYSENIRTNDNDPNIQNMLELNLDSKAAETILQNVKVLAVDQSAERPEEDKIKPGKTVTLAVSVQDSERLTLAADVGDLNLVLRGVGDDAIVEKKWPTVSDARLTNMGDEIFEEFARIKKESGAYSNTVRIYNGNTVDAVQTR